MGWMVLFLYVIIHLRHKTIVKKIDNDVISPSDFTIFIRKIPLKTTVDELKTWLEEKSLPQGKTAPIVKINLAYDIDDFPDLQDDEEEW